MKEILRKDIPIKKPDFAKAISGKEKKRVSYLYRTAQPSTLAAFPPWGIEQELVVQDLPATKIGKE